MARAISQHLTDEEFVDYVLGDLVSKADSEINEHLERCPDCTAALDEYFDAEASFPKKEFEQQREAFVTLLRARLGLSRSPEPTPDSVDHAPNISVRAGESDPPSSSWRRLHARLFGFWQQLSERWLVVTALGEATVIFVLAVTLSYQYGRTSERSERAEFEDAINAGFRDLGRLMIAVVNQRDDEVRVAANRLRVLSLPGSGQEVRPFPTLTGSLNGPTAVSVGLTRYRDLQPAYDGYVQQWSDALLGLSDLLVQTGKVTEATVLFEYLHRKDPANVSLVFALAELYKSAGNQRGAIALYEQVLPEAIRTGDPRPYHFAGYSYFELGEFAKALEYYEKALEISPGYAKVKYNEGLVYLRMPGLEPSERQRRFQQKVEEALALTLKAFEREKDQNPRITFTLAILYSAKQEWNKALEYLELSFKREKTYPFRAKGDPAFEFFRDPAHEPFHARFDQLIASYQPLPSGQFGVRLGRFSRDVFSE